MASRARLKDIQSHKQNLLKTEVAWYTGKTICCSCVDEEKCPESKWRSHIIQKLLPKFYFWDEPGTLNPITFSDVNNNSLPPLSHT